MMTLPEIFVQLPEDIQVALERALETCKLPDLPTEDQVFSATELITEELKNVQFTSAPLDVRNLLDQVPQAVVDMLF
jgi:hypothetical protein